MARIRYVKSIQETNKLMTSEQMAELMKSIAEAAIPVAEGLSPVKTGDYIKSFKATAVRRGGPRRNRAEGRLINTSDHAADVEFTDEGGHRVLGRTVDFITGR